MTLYDAHGDIHVLDSLSDDDDRCTCGAAWPCHKGYLYACGHDAITSGCGGCDPST